MIGFESAASDAEVQAWSKELQVQDNKLIGKLLNDVEAWEKTRVSG
jgi:hypothetical protein